MGRRNVLIEGGSGTGKTAVCEELARRGCQAIHGDRELAYQGDPATGAPVGGMTGIDLHAHHIWDVDKVRLLVADSREEVTFFCGGSRNLSVFVDLFDGVFVLEVDDETLVRRLNDRPGDEWGGAGRQTERDLVFELRGHGPDRAGLPSHAVVINATAPLTDVVDDILVSSRAVPAHSGREAVGEDEGRGQHSDR